MMNNRPKIGDIFGLIQVKNEPFKKNLVSGNTYWYVNVLCFGCGKEKEMPCHSLTTGRSTSCGCVKIKKPDVKHGEKFGFLTVLSEEAFIKCFGTEGHGHNRWCVLVKCNGNGAKNCGKEFVITYQQLRDGNARGCGKCKKLGKDSHNHTGHVSVCE